MPIDGHNGNGLVHLQIGTVGQGNDAVDLVLLGQLEAVFSCHGIIVGGHQQAAVAVAEQAAGEFVGKGGKKGMPQGGHYQRHTVGFVGFQPPGVVIYLVALLFGGSFHLLAVLLAYWQAMGRTAIYSCFSVILINIIAFALAYLVTSGVKGQNFFRAGFFVPNLIGGIVLGYVWKFVFNRAFVALGSAIAGGNVPSLLATPKGAMFCLILVSVWQYAGYMMLIYVAGLMSVSKDVREAAMIDGCNSAQTMRNVTIPLMRSSFVQCLFLSITRCFVVHDVNLSLTKGEPFNSSVMAAMHVYNQAFTYKNYGVGQAEALILFLVCAIVGVTQVMVGKKGEVDA